MKANTSLTGTGSEPTSPETLARSDREVPVPFLPRRCACNSRADVGSATRTWDSPLTPESNSILKPLPNSLLDKPAVAPKARRSLHRSGFTLVEMLVALAATLIMMATVAAIFASVSDSIRDSRATIEMTDRLRGVQNMLQTDLSGITVTPIPSRRPGDGEGYTEIIEGPMGPVVDPALSIELTIDGDSGDPDTTVGDLDDILMFTTRNLREPFIGRFVEGLDASGFPIVGTRESRVAEVAWFVRGTTLYRRVLLVLPGAQSQLPQLDPLDNYYTNANSFQSFYAGYDISARMEGHAPLYRSPPPPPPPPPTPPPPWPRLVANTLGDLTKRENRYAHQPFAYPHDARLWGRLGLPTLQECSSPLWPFPVVPGGMMPTPNSIQSPIYLPAVDYPKSVIVVPDGPPTTNLGTGFSRTPVLDLDPSNSPVDVWTDPTPWTSYVNPRTGNLTQYQNINRIAEDIVMTNVLSFDVKVWDPGAPVLVTSAGVTLQPGDSGYTKYLDESVTGAVTPLLVSYGAYVDLNYMCLLGAQANAYISGTGSGIPRPLFATSGDLRSRIAGTRPFERDFDDPTSWPPPNARSPAVYDTWSFHYERDGFNQDQDMAGGNPLVDEGTNGFDDDGTGGVDDGGNYPPIWGEMEAYPPYPYALRGIQVKIRTFDPDSRQIREVTVGHEFLPE